jgi:hypothetical protein
LGDGVEKSAVPIVVSLAFLGRCSLPQKLSERAAEVLSERGFFALRYGLPEEKKETQQIYPKVIKQSATND